jgi:hypothetical protein
LTADPLLVGERNRVSARETYIYHLIKSKGVGRLAAMENVPFKAPIFSFADVEAATGVDGPWLRTAMQRGGEATLGTKRGGRLLFSLLEIAQISILWGLNRRAGTPPAIGWQVATAFEAVLVDALPEKAEGAAKV